MQTTSRLGQLRIALSAGLLALAVGCLPAPPPKQEAAPAPPPAPSTSVDLAALTKDLSIEQVAIAQLPAAAPLTDRDLAVSIALDRADPTYKIGEALSFTVTSNADAYLWVINIHHDGKVVMLYPNKFEPNNAVKANTPVKIPAEAAGFEVRVSGPAGADLITAFATKSPTPPISAFSVETPEFKQGMGSFGVMATSLAKDLDLVVRSVNCAVAKDLEITAVATEPKPAAPPAAPANPDELCGAPPAGEKPIAPAARDQGFAKADAKFMITP